MERAGDHCEYCLIPAPLSFYAHEVDHVIALKHGGVTAADNLAYACWRCNRYKGSDLGSFDPQTGKYRFLFNPRTQAWNEHFCQQGTRIWGQTPEGRTTVQLLKLNTPERLAERERMRL
ncbi:MAG: HNH endonuclease [Spirulinaceae cyanobacterium SM2_1_0]|nr:HNH endonuclease [Spirulinaceae cyanobacterium SM2_1_0]NJO52342.1 HNH endonuclease [Leptolyngbyaceae cyanobacterium RM2_2_4]